MYLVIGCGLSGVVIAERIANILNKKVLILDKRNHIGGNCYDYIDEDTDILINKYGAHIFHTNNEKVWDYINKFDKWVRWDHHVLSYADNRFVPMPVNISTVNGLCGQNIQTVEEMNEWLKKSQIKYDIIENSEQMGKSRVGEILYEKLFKPYTYKQWNKYPEELDSSVLGRIPLRNNFDTRYFSDKYQVFPHKGYTHFFEKILDNPLIEYKLNTDFFEFKLENNLDKYEGIIYTGPIDNYFDGLDKLEYRSLNFDLKRFKNMNYYQPASVVNYPEVNYPFTRIVEYKHILNQKSPNTIISIETSTDSGEPYYPVPNDKNKNLYEK